MGYKSFYLKKKMGIIIIFFLSYDNVVKKYREYLL